MAVRSSQTIIQALTKPQRVLSSQTIIMVLRSANAPADDATTPPIPVPPAATPFVEPALVEPHEGLAHLSGRVQRLIQDTTQRCFTEAQVRRQVVAEVGRLARQQLFGGAIWIQAVRYRSTYILDDHGLYIAAAQADSTPAAPANLTTLSVSWATFETWGVQVGDIVRNLSSGAVGRVSSVSETALVCSEGFRMRGLGRELEAIEDGQYCVIERPLPKQAIVSIRAVLYSGRPLHHYDTQQFQRLKSERYLQTGIPKMWSTEAAELPNQLWVYPPPTSTGEATLVAPMGPHALPYEGNFTVFVYLNPCPQDTHQLSYEEPADYTPAYEGSPYILSLLPRAFYHPIVYRAASGLLAAEGLCQNLPLAQALADLAMVYLEQLGVSDAQ